MPINPNIALGVQPQQQPNMLGQLGQMMAIKAAQQEIEGSEDVRNAFARGAPEDPTQLLQYGKQGRAAYESLLKGRKEQLDSAEKRLTMTGQIAGYVRDNPTPENFVTAVGTMVQNGVLTRAQAERVIADAGNDPAKIKSYADRAASDAITAVDRMRDATTQRGQNLSHSAAMAGVGATLRGQDLTDARMREQHAFERDRRDVIEGENQYIQKDRYGNLYPVTGFGPMRGPNAPAPALPPAAANAFITPQPTLNNLVQPQAAPVSQPGAPTVANAAALDQQANVPVPKKPVRQPVAVMIDGKAVLVPPEKAVGLPPATADAEKSARLRAQQVKDLDLAISNLEAVTKPKGLISQSTGSGFGRAMDVSAGFFGQATEGAIAGAKLAPIADLVLKMVPRFEGPQSDKDTQSYKEASAQLANTSLPTEIRRQAGIEVLRIMKARKDQFVSSAMNNEGLTSGSSASGADPLGIRP